MADDFIRREDALSAILGEPPDAHYPEWYASIFAGLPAADVAEVVHGQWVHSRYENCSERFEIVKCSRCGHEAYAMAFYVRSGNYCPNCGAKMDGGFDDATS